MLNVILLIVIRLNAVRLNAVRLNAVRLNAVRLNAVRLNAVRLNAVRLSVNMQGVVRLNVVVLAPLLNVIPGAAPLRYPGAAHSKKLYASSTHSFSKLDRFSAIGTFSFK
jgi:hypothetical protein